MSVLQRILDDAAARKRDGEQAVAVFDLDHTLFDNGPRTWQILREFAEAEGHTELYATLGDLPKTGIEYLLNKTLARCGVVDEAIHKAAGEFWKTRFFTDAYQSHDVASPGATDFVKRFWDAGGLVVYLTGRDVPGMLVGCVDSLRKSGFPVGVIRTVPLLKPDFETTDIEFKKEAVEFISTLGRVVAAFDNEPAMCNLFRATWPDALSVFLNTEHAPNPPPLDAKVQQISDFR